MENPECCQRVMLKGHTSNGRRELPTNWDETNWASKRTMAVMSWNKIYTSPWEYDDTQNKETKNKKWSHTECEYKLKGKTTKLLQNNKG